MSNQEGTAQDQKMLPWPTISPMEKRKQSEHQALPAFLDIT